MTADAASHLLQADLESGLSESEAVARITRHGLNRLPDAQAPSPWQNLWREAVQPQNLLLAVIAVVFAGLGHLPSSMFVLGLWGLLTAAGLLLQQRVRRFHQAMRARNEPSAVLLRQGISQVLPADEVVPGDLLLLEKGQRVPADARLVHSYSLQVNEGALTGSHEPVGKSAGFSAPPDARLAERRNLVHAGSMVTNGSGCALVVATGAETELGQASGPAPAAQPSPTLRQEKVAAVSRLLAGASLTASLLITYLAWALNGLPVEDSILAFLALAFAALPLAVPQVYDLLLALGTHQLARRSAIVRDLSVVEILDTLTIVASDKTGTLTANEPHIERWVPSVWQPQLLELGVATCLVAQQAEPLDAALLRTAEEAGINLETMRRTWPVVALNSFDNSRKRMSVVFRRNDRSWAVIKGAPEAILSLCTRRWTGDGGDEMLAADRELALESAAVLAGAGLRVLALAEHRLEPDLGNIDGCAALIETDLVFAGMVAFSDSLRTEAAATVQRVQAAGLRVLLLTGEHPAAGLYAARELGLPSSEEPLTESRLESQSPAEIYQALEGQSLVARLTPSMRLKIVQSLQAAGERVAATGDRPGDAPVLAAADLGVAVSQGGADAARQEARLFLEDNNFQSLGDAIFTGRLVTANQSKALGFALACKFGLLQAVLLPVLFRLPMPLTPLQLLLAGLVSDLLAATLFLTEPAEPGLERQPPRDPAAPLIDKLMTGRILRGAVALFVAVNAAYFSTYLISGSLPSARAVALAAWLIALVLAAYSLRSDHTLILRQNLVSNRWLVFWVAGVTGLLALINSVPWIGSVLSRVPLQQVPRLASLDWGLALFAALFGVGLAELRKLLGLLKSRPVGKTG